MVILYNYIREIKIKFTVQFRSSYPPEGFYLLVYNATQWSEIQLIFQTNLLLATLWSESEPNKKPPTADIKQMFLASHTLCF
jgi:hypothetical protein